ncbi:MAG: hypothetical protein J0I20_23090 [Chloroflexi bacterium]|nr:hypothetical protein [Chloroflexota bacterium]
MKLTTSNLIRWTGLSAIMAGVLYVLVGIFHPLNVLSSVNTTEWIVVHIFATAMCFFGLLGITGLYARQMKKTGWLGLAGFLLLSLWLILIGGFTFVEVFILPVLATTTPAFVEGFLGSYSGTANGTDFGVLTAVWNLTAPLYILGGLSFGIATIRAGLLSRWAAGLLAFGTALAPLAALLPADFAPKVAVPVGLALAWLGYSLWSERPAYVVDPVPGREKSQSQPILAE